MSEANVALVRGLYDAFGRGDLPSILAALAADADWIITGSNADYPSFGSWKGPEGAGEFFQKLMEAEELNEFSPREFHGSGDKVFVLGDYRPTIRKTGRTFQVEWCHVFTICGGKVSRWQAFTDTAKYAAAWRD